jgi:tRNA pseudouridine65 synthase
VILHRDARCVAVDKPSGVATHRGWADDDDALLQRVRDAVDCYVYPIHRLDRGASGIVLFALDKDVARAFSEAWRAADKRYLAITRGHPPEHAVIDHAIDGAESRTEIWRRRTFGRYAVVEARPHTGRLHQIRRRLKHISCPLIGDVRYGKGEHNRLFRERFALHRLALHCTSLRVPQPRRRRARGHLSARTGSRRGDRGRGGRVHIGTTMIPRFENCALPPPLTR